MCNIFRREIENILKMRNTQATNLRNEREYCILNERRRFFLKTHYNQPPKIMSLQFGIQKNIISLQNYYGLNINFSKAFVNSCKRLCLVYLVLQFLLFSPTSNRRNHKLQILVSKISLKSSQILANIAERDSPCQSFANTLEQLYQ